MRIFENHFLITLGNLMQWTFFPRLQHLVPVPLESLMTLCFCQKITIRRREMKEMSGFSLVNSYDSVLHIRRLQSRSLCSLPANILKSREKVLISFFTLIWKVAYQLGNSSVTQHVTHTEETYGFILVEVFWFGLVLPAQLFCFFFMPRENIQFR